MTRSVQIHPTQPAPETTPARKDKCKRKEKQRKKKDVNKEDKEPDSIGRATMKEDGTIILDLKAVGEDGQVGSGRLVYSPTHPEYENIKKHLGGIEPGESKPVPPFENK
jgi:hypothetical protein